MIHPLLTKVLTQPGLFVEHAGAYAELAAVEVRTLGQRWRRVALYAVLAGLLGLMGLGLAGVAALLWAAVPAAQMPAPWLLVALPGVVLAAAAVLGWLAWRVEADEEAFSLLRHQLQEDARLVDEAARA